MVKPSRDDIKKQIQKQDDDFIGDETLGSGSPRPEVDDDVEEAVKDIVGNEPDPGIEEEIEKDEESEP